MVTRSVSSQQQLIADSSNISKQMNCTSGRHGHVNSEIPPIFAAPAADHT